MKHTISRRAFVRAFGATLLGSAGSIVLSRTAQQAGTAPPPHDDNHEGGHSGLLVGAVDHQRNGFDPLHMLVDWDYGQVSTLPNGQTLREAGGRDCCHVCDSLPGEIDQAPLLRGA